MSDLVRSGNSIIMPFGEYRGWKIEDIPSSYLKYAAENWGEDTDMRKALVAECDKEWQHRERYNRHFNKDEAENTLNG